MKEHLMTNGPRLHSLDALRATMMWLGIVLHSAMLYMEPGIDIHRSPETSLIATSLFGWIHIFRMPVFFMLAGFFTCMLIERKGVNATLLHRAKRIALPFVLFWPVLFVLINVTIEAHATRLDPSAPGVSFQIEDWLVTTGHLWFLYYLIFFTPSVAVFAWVLKKFMSPRRRSTWLDGAAVMMRSWWGIVLLSLLAAVLSEGYPASIMTGDGEFLPALSSISYYLIFYLAGWVLFARFSSLTMHYAKRWRLYFGIAVPAFFGANALGFAALGLFGEAFVRSEVDFAFRAIYSISVWLWSGFFIGLFLQIFQNNSPLLRYFSDSSYWVYLSHYPIVLALAYAFYLVELPALLKMSVLIVLTSMICLSTYHLMIRYTMIGSLLNGHRGGMIRGKTTVAPEQNRKRAS